MKTNGYDQTVPVIYKQTGEESKRIASQKEIDAGQYLISTDGFTKREVIAKDIMCAIISNPNLCEWKDASCAIDAIRLADILINELNKTQ